MALSLPAPGIGWRSPSTRREPRRGTATTPVLAKFIDGVKISNELLPTWPAAWDHYQFPITGPSGSIFTDGWGGSSETYVSSVQFSNGRRPDAFLVALGGPSPLKIPGAIKGPD